MASDRTGRPNRGRPAADEPPGQPDERDPVPGGPRLLLASGSPRRRLLLPLLGLPFRVAVTELEERPEPGESPLAAALRIARDKAAAASPEPDEVVLAADTVVALAGRILGKPADAAEARSMLRDLRGRSHLVITGVALRGRGGAVAGPVATEVWMRPYSDEEIEAYVARGEPFDKAGAYAVQDRIFRPVERLTGCYLNVAGLPLCEVVRGLRSLGLLPIERALEPLVPPCRYCHKGETIVAIG